MAEKQVVRRAADLVLAFVVLSVLAACVPLPGPGTSRAPSAPNEWYVDRAANGNNNGTSWADAWESFAAIDWGTGGVVAGDTVYISGGSTSETYFETLTVAASGRSGSPVTIDVGANSPSPARHDGTVIIDGGSTRASGIVVYNYDYITVNGLDGEGAYKLLVRNHTGEAVGSVEVRNSSYTAIDYVRVDNGKSRGIFFDRADHSRIRGCDVRTGRVNYPAQTDGLYLQFGNDNTIENTVVVLGNADTTNHMDCLQVANQENRLTIRGNWFEWTNGVGNSLSQTFIIEGSSDWVRFYNNVVLGGSNNPYQAALFKEANGGAHYIWNNIIIAQHPTGIALKANSMTDAEFGAIKNNIIYSSNGYPVFLNTAVTPTKMDYNLLYRSNGAYVSYMAGTNRTWEQHQAAGYDNHGINAAPDYNPADEYRLNPTSPCIDAGTPISDYFTTDRDGAARPNGAAWDIGAYEYVRSGPTNTPTATPTNTPTVTPTETPPSVTLTGRVALEGRGAAGDPRWVTDLYRVEAGVTTEGIEVYPAGSSSLAGSYSATTDASGRFSVIMTGIKPGVYDLRVKGADTLSNRRLALSLPGGEIDFGTLLVGDCNGNDAINGADASYLIPSFLCCEPDACYRRYADVNKNGCVNGADMSLFIPNFLKAGPIDVTRGAQRPTNGAARGPVPGAGAGLSLAPAVGTVEVGEVFTVDIVFDTGTGSADTVDAYIGFDPAYLEVVNSSGEPAGSIELNTAVFSSATYNVANNATGQIDFSASKFESPYLTGAYKAATIRFRAKAAVASTELAFVRSGARVSDVLLGGVSLDPVLSNAPVSAGQAAIPTAATH